MKPSDRGLPSRPAEVQVYPDTASLAQAVAAHILAICKSSIQARGVCSLVLSGGSTPQAAYSLLAQREYAQGMEWSRLHVFWGDERQVPPDHAYSNYRMAWQVLLSKVPIPAENIHRMHGELEARQAVVEYERELQDFFRRTEHARGERAGFDLVLLGLGEDGHVASLFPGSPALEEGQDWVAAVEHNAPPPPLVPRLSLTLTAIGSARQVTFIVSGEGKAGILQRVLEGRSPSGLLPAQRVQPANGRLLWMLDRLAASHLSHA